METITFIYKSKVEQFAEQFPSLYDEIYQLGYREAITASMYNDKPVQDYPQYAIPKDDSERFCYFGSWDSVRNKAIELEHQGYLAGNRDWQEFMDGYKDWNEKIMYIAWNPTHKQFAVESDYSVIDEYYEHLVGAGEENN